MANSRMTKQELSHEKDVFLAGGQICDSTLYRLSLKYTEVSETAGERILAKAGLEGFSATLNGSHLWVKIKTPTNSESVKAALNAIGYPNCRTFQAIYGEGDNEYKEWVVQASTSLFFGDPKGFSRGLRKMMQAVNVEPLYVYAYVGTISIECKTLADAEQVLEIFKDDRFQKASNIQGRLMIVEDATRSNDVFVVRNIQDGERYTPI